MKPQLPSRAPLVVDKLLELLEVARQDDAHALHEVQVIDGPVRNLVEIDNDAISVAAGTEDVPGFVSNFERLPQLGRNAYEERVEVGMAIASFSGDVDMAPRRARAAELLAGVKAVIDANQVVDDAWDSAALGAEIAWYPQQNESGSTVELGFTLVFRAVI